MIATNLKKSLLLPSAIGLISGFVFYLLIAPGLMGWRTPWILERAANLWYFFRGYPLIVFPFVVCSTALFRPATRRMAFTIALSLSGALFVPVPVFNEWCFWAEWRGAFDSRVLSSVADAFLIQCTLAIVISYVTSILAPAFNQLCAWALGDAHKRKGQ